MEVAMQVSPSPQSPWDKRGLPWRTLTLAYLYMGAWQHIVVVVAIARDHWGKREKEIDQDPPPTFFPITRTGKAGKSGWKAGSGFLARP